MNHKFQIDGDSPPPKRKQPLLNENCDDNRRRRIGEVAGGATAECAVMCCCIPVAIINLLILAVYKVPAGLGKKVWRRRKRERLLKKRRENFGSGRREESGSGRSSGGSGEFGECGLDIEDDEMWGELYGTGFWRVPSLKNQEIVVDFD